MRLTEPTNAHCDSKLEYLARNQILNSETNSYRAIETTPVVTTETLPSTPTNPIYKL
jgi:hypothetical protein